MEDRKYMYRAVAHYDENGAEIVFQRFIIIGETPCFHKVLPDFESQLIAWSEQYPNNQYWQSRIKKATRRVSKSGRRPWCHETIKGALYSLYYRRHRQLDLAAVECRLSRAIITKIQPMLEDDRLIPIRAMGISVGKFPEMESVIFD